MPAKTRTSAPIYQLNVTLRYSTPPIWRRLQVRSDTTLFTLHYILQIAMGWTNSHLHQFIADGIYYGESDLYPDMDVVSEHRTRLNRLVSDVNDTFMYEYDFGDSWEHDIVVEEILEPEPKVRYPRCIKGKRACPPEDIGGVWGYDTFLEAIQNKDHPEHAEYLEWLGGSFDSETFDIEAVNANLKQIH